MKKAIVRACAISRVMFCPETGDIEFELHDNFGRLAILINEFFLDDCDFIDTLGLCNVVYKDKDYRIGKTEWRTLRALLDNNNSLPAELLAEKLGIKKESAIRYGKMLSTALTDLFLPFEVLSREEITLQKISK